MSKQVLNSIRLTTSALAMSLALCTAGTAHAAEVTYNFNIPAESTAKALMDFSRQANVQILFPYDAVATRMSGAIAGQFDRATVLKRLLDGSGLVVANETDAVITLKLADRAEKNAGEASPTTEVIVTGSHIRGGNPTSPVLTLTRKDIEESGFSQIGDLMRSLPENFAGGQNPGVIGALAGGSTNANASNASTVNLRGLGSDATLVLVNGHRLPGDSLYQGSDISGIPLGAVQRIEIVPDGASALYGSDAVAGVVNFVLRKDYDGGEVSAVIGGASQGGGEEHTYSVLWGKSLGDWYGLADIEYSKQNEILAGQRAFLAGASPIATVMEPQTRRSLFVSAGGAFDADVKFGLDALIGDRTASYVQQTSKTSYIGYNNTYTPSYSVTPSLDVDLGGTWKLHADGGLSQSHNANLTSIPAYAYTSRTAYSNGVGYAEATADGTLFSLPSGPVKGAFGGGYRRETFRTGLPTSSAYVDKARDVEYGFGEVQVPVVSPSIDRVGLNALDVTLSARAEHYSDFGSSTNPRVGLRYVPVRDLSLRGSWGTSFKAPSFTQMYYYPALYLYPARSLGSSATTSGATAILESGGNANLKPEKSRSWTLGADYTPKEFRSLKLSATYFDIDFTDRIVQPVSNLVAALSNPIYAPFVDPAPTSTQQSDLIASIPTFINYAGATYTPGKVVAIVDDAYQNATAQKANGVDLSYRQTFQMSEMSLDSFADATWLSLRQQTISTQPLATLSGRIFQAPKFKARGGLSWTRGGLTVTGIVNYIDHEIDNISSPSAMVGSWTTVDANITYRLSQGGVLKGVSFVAAASNMFDRNPPYALAATRAYQGLDYDSTNASVVGRFVTFSVKKAW